MENSKDYSGADKHPNKRNYLDISTAHIKAEHRVAILETKGRLNLNTNLYGYPYKEGIFITIGELDDVDDIIHDHNEGYDDITDIVRYCNGNGIDLIRFDADAESMEDIFKTYNW